MLMPTGRVEGKVGSRFVNNVLIFAYKFRMEEDTVIVEETGITLSTNQKYVFFSYNLGMERCTVLILTWLSAQYQYL